jgi:hypothetical protein
MQQLRTVPRMTDRSDGMRRPSRAPLPARSRKRWITGLSLAALWALLMLAVGSVVAGTLLLVLLAVFTGVVLLSLRMLGVTREHPWVQQLATRPWRDGRDVLQLGLRHLTEVFIVSPTGSLLAPNVVELRMNPGDFASLTDLMDTDLINASAADAYLAAITAREARLASAGAVEVRVNADPAVPAGRYQFRQGRLGGASLAPGYSQPPASYAAPAAIDPGHQPAYAGYAGPPPPGYAGPPAMSPVPPVPSPAVPGASGYATPPAYPLPAPVLAAPVLAGPAGTGPAGAGQPEEAYPWAHDGFTAQEPAAALTAPAPEARTVSAPTALLRLVTGGSAAETRVSGARAGRGVAAELRLPDDPTVSRIHATFTFNEGQWWITGTGLNGLVLNCKPLQGDHPVRDGDVIKWGTRPDSLTSRVETR